MKPILMKSKGLGVLLFAFVLITAFSKPHPFTGTNPPWDAPTFTDTIHNPCSSYETDAAANGKKVYTKFCVACHGVAGKGDGIAAVSLSPHPANFLLPSVVNESDGALFWKITNGKSPMPAWEKSISTDQRWQLVCYIRTLEKKAGVK